MPYFLERDRFEGLSEAQKGSGRSQVGRVRVLIPEGLAPDRVNSGRTFGAEVVRTMVGAAPRSDVRSTDFLPELDEAIDEADWALTAFPLGDEVHESVRNLRRPAAVRLEGVEERGAKVKKRVREEGEPTCAKTDVAATRAGARGSA